LEMLGLRLFPLSSRAVLDGQQARNMATLKEMKNRIRSVKSIQKITKSMKVVASTRLKKANEGMLKNKPSLLRMEEFFTEYQKDSVPKEKKPVKNYLVVCVTTERGLCGGVNSSVVKCVKRIIETSSSVKGLNLTFRLLGNKSIQALTRLCGHSTAWSAKTIGFRSGPKFADILPIAERLSAENYDKCTIVRNRFINLLSYQTLEMPLVSRDQLLEMESNAYEFDSGIREGTLKNFHQWYTAITLIGYFTENYCIEIGQRMTSMDNATKNAGSLIKTLTTKMNRRRQTKITTEICEIITGASAVESGEY